MDEKTRKTNRGGARRGTGRKPVVGGRAWLRAVADDPTNRRLFERAVRDDLAAGRTDSFIRAFEGGYGRAPQALDIRQAIVDESGQAIYAAQFDDGVEFASSEAACTTPPSALPVSTPLARGSES